MKANTCCRRFIADFVFCELTVWGALEQPPIQPIVGGQEALKDEYPWQILLKYKDSFTCGGSILNERTILTAAFCVDNDLSQR